MSRTMTLDGGYSVRLADSNYGEDAFLIAPDGTETMVWNGDACVDQPEDSIWCRDIGRLFMTAFSAGVDAGKRASK